MKTTRTRALERYVWFLFALTAFAALLVLIGHLATRKLIGDGGWTAIVAGVAVSWVASAIGAWPVLTAEARGRAAGPTELLASLASRVLVVLIIGLGVALGTGVERPVFLIWIGISYLALLVVDVGYLLKGDRRPAETE